MRRAHRPRPHGQGAVTLPVHARRVVPTPRPARGALRNIRTRISIGRQIFRYHVALGSNYNPDTQYPTKSNPSNGSRRMTCRPPTSTSTLQPKLSLLMNPSAKYRYHTLRKRRHMNRAPLVRYRVHYYSTNTVLPPYIIISLTSDEYTPTSSHPHILYIHQLTSLVLSF